MQNAELKAESMGRTADKRPPLGLAYTQMDADFDASRES